MPSIHSSSSLSLTGDLTTPHAEAVRAQVLAALSDHSAVTIDCSSATDMDVAFVQILVAASRFAAQSGKTVALASPPTGLFAETLRRCGFPQAQPPTAVLAQALSLSVM